MALKGMQKQLNKILNKLLPFFLIFKSLVIISIFVGFLFLKYPNSFTEYIFYFFQNIINWHSIGKILVETLFVLRESLVSLLSSMFFIICFLFLGFLCEKKKINILFSLRIISLICVVLSFFYFTGFYLSYIYLVLIFALFIIINGLIFDYYDNLFLKYMFIKNILIFIPFLSEVIFPIPVISAGMIYMKTAKEKARKVVLVLQVLLIGIIFPIIIWVTTSYLYNYSLYNKAFNRFFERHFVERVNTILSNPKRSDIYQIISDEKSRLLFVNCSQTRRILILSMDKPDKIIKSIPTGIRFYDIIFNPVTKEIYYFDNQKNCIIALNISNFKHITTRYSQPIFRKFEEHCFLIFDEGNQKLYAITSAAAHQREKTEVVEICLKKLHIIRRIENLGYSCRDLLFDKERRLLYISFDFEKGVKIFNIDTWKLINKLDVNNFSSQMAISYKFNEIFMANASGSNIYVFDANTFSLKRKIKVDIGTRCIGIDDVNDIMIVNSVITSRVLILDMVSGKITDHYSGFYPYFRKIHIPLKGGQAFIGTWQFLYEITY